MCHDLGQEFCEEYVTYVLTKKNKKIRFKFSLKTSCDSETFIAVSQEGRRRLRDELELSNNAKLPIKLQMSRFIAKILSCLIKTFKGLETGTIG